MPPSRSEAIRSGSLERRCRTLSLAAISIGEPIEMMIPPTCERIDPAAAPVERVGRRSRVVAGEPGHDQLGDLLPDA